MGIFNSSYLRNNAVDGYKIEKTVDMYYIKDTSGNIISTLTYNDYNI